jgi:hypothetical protein
MPREEVLGSLCIFLLENEDVSKYGADHNGPPPQSLLIRFSDTPDGRVQLSQGKPILGVIGAHANRRGIFTRGTQTDDGMPHATVRHGQPGQLLEPEIIKQGPCIRRSRDLEEITVAALLIRVLAEGGEGSLGYRVGRHGPLLGRGGSLSGSPGERGDGRGDIAVTCSVANEASITSRFCLITADVALPMVEKGNEALIWYILKGGRGMNLVARSGCSWIGRERGKGVGKWGGREATSVRATKIDTKPTNTPTHLQVLHPVRTL